MSNDGRIRVIKAQKISYWKQFEHGMLSREAVQVLTALADSSMDKPDRLYDWFYEFSVFLHIKYR